MTLEEVLQHFSKSRKSGRDYSVQCPSHEDKKNSLSIGEADEKILVKCHAGCQTESILSAVGLKLSDLFTTNGNGKASDPVTHRYVYVDEHGSPLFRVCRTAYKNFFQERYESGAYIPKLNGVRRVLYNLPEIIKANAVFVVEGEKDVETLRGHGLVATTNPGGADAWSDSYAEPFRDKWVFIIPDNDQPGRKHAWRVARSILPFAKEVRLIELPGVPEKGDVTDYLAKHTKEELRNLVKAAKPVTAKDVEEKSKTESQNPKNDERRPVTVRISEVEREEVVWCWENRIPLKKLSIVEGDPGLGKSQLTLAIAAPITKGLPIFGDEGKCEPATVLILSAEDGLADTIRPRLEDMGADLSKVVALTAMVDETGKERAVTLADLDILEAAITEHKPRLLIVDPIIAFTAGADTHKANEVRGILAPLAALAERHACAVIAVRHLNKGNGRAIYRGQGTIDFLAACRSCFLVGENPDDPTEKVLVHVKSNLGPKTSSLTFSIEQGRFLWGKETTITADEILATPANSDEKSQIDEAVEFLKKVLANGPVMSKKVFKDARESSVSERTLWRAKSKLKVKAGKEGFQTEWHWSLDTKSAKPPSNPAKLSKAMADVADFDEDIKNKEEKTNPYPKSANSENVSGSLADIDEEEERYAKEERAGIEDDDDFEVIPK
jgi:putative DNA primase/helicase